MLSESLQPPSVALSPPAFRNQKLFSAWDNNHFLPSAASTIVPNFPTHSSVIITLSANTSKSAVTLNGKARGWMAGWRDVGWMDGGWTLFCSFYAPTLLKWSHPDLACPQDLIQKSWLLSWHPGLNVSGCLHAEVMCWDGGIAPLDVFHNLKECETHLNVPPCCRQKRWSYVEEEPEKSHVSTEARVGESCQEVKETPEANNSE